MTDTQQRECPTCGVQLNADGTVDEMDPLDPQGHYNGCDLMDPCICGNILPVASVTFHWRAANSATMVAQTCSPVCSDKVEAVRDVHGILTMLSVNDLRFSACTNSDHDHTTPVDRDGMTLPEPQPQRCYDCCLPTHYVISTGNYQHDDPAAPDCFAIKAALPLSPCVEPVRCPTCNHPAGAHFEGCQS